MKHSLGWCAYAICLVAVYTVGVRTSQAGDGCACYRIPPGPPMQSVLACSKCESGGRADCCNGGQCGGTFRLCVYVDPVECWSSGYDANSVYQPCAAVFTCAPGFNCGGQMPCAFDVEPEESTDYDTVIKLDTLYVCP